MIEYDGIHVLHSSLCCHYEVYALYLIFLHALSVTLPSPLFYFLDSDGEFYLNRCSCGNNRT
jgi:hypothetical protein